MNNKIGIGVITCDRKNFFDKCIKSIPETEELIVINDGKPYDNYPSKVKKLIQHSSNKTVGVSKNEAMRYLIQQGCDHIFLIEDDTEIINENVFEKYIKLAEESGIWHLNYGPGSPMNREQDPEVMKLDLAGRHLWSSTSKPKTRAIIPYENEELALYRHCAGCFSYFYRGIIKNIGYHDEKFKNAWEHIDLMYRVIQQGLHPPFWWFADIANSDQYINDMDDSIIESSITKDQQKWRENIMQGVEWFKHKHGYRPVEIPDTKPDDVLKKLELIQSNYARKVL